MENLDKKPKSPEKIREERMNYLRSQISLLIGKKEDLEASEAYKNLQKSHYDKMYELKRENIRVGKILDGKGEQKYAKSIARDEKKIEKLKDEYNNHPITLELEDLKNKTRALNDEFESLEREGQNIEKENFQQQLNVESIRAEKILEQLFAKSEHIQSEYIQPKMDQLGMTRESAIETLDFDIKGKVQSIDYGLSQIDKVQEQLQDLKEGKGLYRAQERIAAIKQELDRIEKNYINI